MTVQRMDHVGVVVEDLEAAIAFFVELGLEPAGDWTIENALADRVIGLGHARSRCAMLKSPDGHGQLELIAFERPTDGGEPRGDLVDYEGSWLLCYLRGPAGVIVELAERR